MIIFIGGCTASGKTRLALSLAEALGNTEIINGDSLQLYKDLQILTARPFENDFRSIPHHLYGVLESTEITTVAWWHDEATKIINALHPKTIIVVGGTGLYLSSLIRGLSPMPQIPFDIKTFVRNQQQTLSQEDFKAWVEKLDPQVVELFQDRQRLARAAEVILASGSSILSFQKRPEGALTDFRMITLLPPKDILYEHINQRFLKMIEQGAIDEIKNFRGKQPPEYSPLFKALGYKEIEAYLRGEVSLDVAIVQAQQMSRNYAKRQMTWFRNQMPQDIIIEALTWDLKILINDIRSKYL